MGGLVNALEAAREHNMQFFTPSSIGAFGPNTPKDMTPQKRYKDRLQCMA